ncbi:hypothetical protein D9757_014802 [Collybiopsis confluens]|uniref:HAT C-terminal dimerisation domain-containing protein n=1 Tax=Collybiopsis confluens TaxID=2823264 RepID=A0A8H5FP88_9AGAR|nr:hypothetical protein D9757_014802 [Collybiopsis confluens]
MSCRHGKRFGTTWISLAWDYLSIMGASTSSERAFSGGGLIITKLRNQLRGNLVEALQVTKVTLQQELIELGLNCVMWANFYLVC